MELFESLGNHTVVAFSLLSKKHIFIVNCNVCCYLFQFYITGSSIALALSSFHVCRLLSYRTILSSSNYRTEQL